MYYTNNDDFRAIPRLLPSLIIGIFPWAFHPWGTQGHPGTANPSIFGFLRNRRAIVSRRYASLDYIALYHSGVTGPQFSRNAKFIFDPIRIALIVNIDRVTIVLKMVYPCRATTTGGTFVNHHVVGGLQFLVLPDHR